MAKVSLNTLKSWFKNGLKPTEGQFWAWMDSYWHKDEKLPIESVEELDLMLSNKADTEQLTNHVGDEDAHGIPDLTAQLENQIATKTDKGGYQGTSQDLFDSIQTNAKAIADYLPPEYTIEADVDHNLILRKDGEVQSQISLAQYLELPSLFYWVDGNRFTYVPVVGTGTDTIAVGDILTGGVFEVDGTKFFGDLLCLDISGDLATGIGTTWKPLNQKQI